MKSFWLPNLQPNQPIKVAGVTYTVQAIRVSGIDIFVKVRELEDYFKFDETKMQCNYKEFKK